MKLDRDDERGRYRGKLRTWNNDEPATSYGEPIFDNQKQACEGGISLNSTRSPSLKHSSKAFAWAATSRWREVRGCQTVFCEVLSFEQHERNKLVLDQPRAC